MNQRILILIITILIVASFQNCKRCHDKNLGTFYLTNSDRRVIPYSEQSKLTYKFITGDSLKFTIDTIATDFFDASWFNSGEDHPECRDYFTIEQYVVRFKDKTDSNKTEILLSKLPGTGFSMFLYFNYTMNDTIIGFSETYSPIQDSIPGNYYSHFQIGPKTFSNVHEFLGYCNPAYEHIHYLYYTRDQGIVGFKTCKGKICYLESN